MNWISDLLSGGLRKEAKKEVESADQDKNLQNDFLKDVMDIDEKSLAKEADEVQRSEEEAHDIKPDEGYDEVGAIMDYESGQLDDQGILELFSHLVRTGRAWHLQGHYGRTASALIEAGYLDEEGNILKEIGAEASIRESLNKKAAYEKGDTSPETVEKDYKLRISGLSDYNLAEILAESATRDKESTTVNFNEEKEKQLKSVKSDRAAAEAKVYNIIKDHTLDDWKKAFDNMKDWEHKPATEEELRGKDWSKKNWRTNDKEFNEVDDKEREKQMEGTGKEEEKGQVGKEASKKTAEEEDINLEEPESDLPAVEQKDLPKEEPKKKTVDDKVTEKIEEKVEEKTEDVEKKVEEVIEKHEEELDQTVEKKVDEKIEEAFEEHHEEHHPHDEKKEEQHEEEQNKKIEEIVEEEKEEPEHQDAFEEKKEEPKSEEKPEKESSKKKADGSYQGWSNRSTWLTVLWIDNDQGLYEQVSEITSRSTDPYKAGQEIKAFIDEMAGETTGNTGLFADLVNQAIREIDWLEIAEHYMPEAEEEPEEDVEPEIAPQSSKKEVLKKVAEISSPWKVVKNEKGEEVIARIVPKKTTKLSKDKENHTDKQSKELQ